MKENLKIETQNKRDNAEATKLFRDLGYLNVFADELNVYAIAVPSNKDPRTVSFDELRELARPKEYLNDKFELVVANQPDDGWVLVPDGAECYAYFKHTDKHCFYRNDLDNTCLLIFDNWQKPKDWYETSYRNIYSMKDQSSAKILWQRENKVETVKGRFLHQWAYEAFGRGEDLLLKMINNKSTVLQVNSAMGLHIFDDANNHFSLKPQTITIGSRTINKPISVKPEMGDIVYVANLTDIDLVTEQKWKNTVPHIHFFDLGLLHKSKEEAIAHCEALLELMK